MGILENLLAQKEKRDHEAARKAAQEAVSQKPPVSQAPVFRAPVSQAPVNTPSEIIKRVAVPVPGDKLEIEIILIKDAKDVYSPKHFETTDELLLAIKRLQDSTPNGYYAGYRCKFILGDVYCLTSKGSKPVRDKWDVMRQKQFGNLVAGAIKYLHRKTAMQYVSKTAN